MEEVQIAAMVLSIIQQASGLYQNWLTAQSANDLPTLQSIEAKLAAQNDLLMKQ